MRKKKEMEVNSEEKKLSFVEKIRTDKKYSAKVQLIGYGAFIVVLVIYLNISSMGNSISSGNIVGNTVNSGNSLTEVEENDSSNLLEQLENNYRYDTVVTIYQKDATSGEKIKEGQTLHYYGQSYQNELEITKEVSGSNELYYKVDDRYYSKIDDVMNLVEDEIIYILVSDEYIEVESILKLIEQSSLDHVTDYSTGKKEYVYHLNVKDVIISAQRDDVVEIQVTMENDELFIEIDYSKLLSLIEESIYECNLQLKITDIGKVEEFLILENEKEDLAE